MDRRAVRAARQSKKGDSRKKLIEHAEWRFGEAGEVAAALQRSDAALKKRAALQGREYVSQFPHAAMHPPPLLTENIDAWNLFSSCQSQVITAGLGTVVGIDESTLKWK